MNKDEIINEEFKKVFKSFQYPFVTADQAISKLTAKQKAKYYKDAIKIRDNPIVKKELNEICRHFYYTLAMNSTEGDKNLYKGAMLFANKFYARFGDLAGRDPMEKQKATDKANEKINDYLPE